MDRLVDRNVIDIKYDAEGEFEKLKAHLTCRDFMQVKGEDYEETRAPACRLQVLRALLVKASSDKAFLTAQWGLHCRIPPV
jgi:hypothetical protein